ncbi:MAG: hypothetical protein KKG59_07320 [Nanoarchaeota archaeon]|nr:hypothetical protein [Nanoarchaeota archaeon]
MQASQYQDGSVLVHDVFSEKVDKLGHPKETYMLIAEVPSDREHMGEYVDKFESELVDMLKKTGMAKPPEELVIKIMLGMNDMLFNAGQYGNNFSPDKPVYVSMNITRYEIPGPEGPLERRIMILGMYTNDSYYDPASFQINDARIDDNEGGNQGLGHKIIKEMFDTAVIENVVSPEGKPEHSGMTVQKVLD